MNRVKTPSAKARPRVSREDPVSLRAVGWIALGGFLLGIIWPWMAGISLVPAAPLEERSNAALEEVASVEPAAGEEETGGGRELSAEELIEIGEAEITSCRDAAGKAVSKCDAIEMDALVHAALRELTSCKGATGVFGVLSLGMDLDFEKKAIENVKSGRSTDLPGAAVQELLSCARKNLATVPLSEIAHEQASYTVFYRLRFKTPEIALAEAGTVVPASGNALVRWQTALIRENPEREAKVRARVLSGTRLIVTGRQGEWYRVKYDARGREGWVHGAAIGMKAESAD